jgi:hypothetical protein
VWELAESHKRMLEDLLARQEEERRQLRQQFEERQQQLIRYWCPACWTRLRGIDLCSYFKIFI